MERSGEIPDWTRCPYNNESRAEYLQELLECGKVFPKEFNPRKRTWDGIPFSQWMDHVMGDIVRRAVNKLSGSVLDDPLPLPEGMSKEDAFTLSVHEGAWRPSPHFVCRADGHPAYLNPYLNRVWGCKSCETTTDSPFPFFCPKEEFEEQLEGKTKH